MVDAAQMIGIVLMTACGVYIRHNLQLLLSVGREHVIDFLVVLLEGGVLQYAIVEQTVDLRAENLDVLRVRIIRMPGVEESVGCGVSRMICVIMVSPRSLIMSNSPSFDEIAEQLLELFAQLLLRLGQPSPADLLEETRSEEKREIGAVLSA
jgi:hypothetical protein